MVLPTAPTAYSTAQVLANPIELNSRLGTYTNFVNLLDLCGLALPAAMRPDGIPFGITLLAPAGATRSSPASAAVSCRHQTEDGSQGPDAAAARALPTGARRRNRHRRGRRASLRHGAERRIAGARRTPARATAPRRTTSSMRSTPRRRNPACCASSGRGTSIKLELWALSAAASANSSPRFRRRSIGTSLATAGKGISGEPPRSTAPAIFPLRRLARVHGEKGSVMGCGRGANQTVKL
jgi:allophanate hydrolase